METLSSSDPVRGREAPPDPDTDIDSLEELREVRWVKEEESKPTDPLSIHIGIIAMAISIGWLIQQGLLWIENQTWGAGEEEVRLITLKRSMTRIETMRPRHIRRLIEKWV